MSYPEGLLALRATRVLALATVQLAAACAISLDHDRPIVDASVATLAGCEPWTEGELDGYEGRLAATALDDDTLLLAPATLRRRGGARDAASILIVPSAATASCAGVGAPTRIIDDAIELSALTRGDGAQVLSFVARGDERWAFLEVLTGFERVGIGIARWDAQRERLVASPALLFTGDRPRYGEAAVVDDGAVYVFGCAEAGFLRDSCFVARAPIEALESSFAYEFYRGTRELAKDPDAAIPIFDGGRGLTVVARGDRWIAAYPEPLSATLVLRSGLGATGPWSAPHTAGNCAHAKLCGELTAPEPLASGAKSLTVFHARYDFVDDSISASRSAVTELELDDLP